jgi:cell division septation protein DedD
MTVTLAHETDARVPAGGASRLLLGVAMVAALVAPPAAAADKVAASLKAAGFTSYVVKEAGLFKVRAGPYPDRPKALVAAEQIRKKLGHTSPFLVKEP